MQKEAISHTFINTSTFNAQQTLMQSLPDRKNYILYNVLNLFFAASFWLNLETLLGGWSEIGYLIKDILSITIIVSSFIGILCCFWKAKISPQLFKVVNLVLILAIPFGPILGLWAYIKFSKIVPTDQA